MLKVSRLHHPQRTLFKQEEQSVKLEQGAGHISSGSVRSFPHIPATQSKFLLWGLKHLYRLVDHWQLLKPESDIGLEIHSLQLRWDSHGSGHLESKESSLCVLLSNSNTFSIERFSQSQVPPESSTVFLCWLVCLTYLDQKVLWLTAFVTVRYGALVELRAFYGLMNPLLSSVAVDFPITVSLLRDALSAPITTMAPLTARICGRWTVNRKLSQAIPTSCECIAILFCLKDNKHLRLKRKFVGQKLQKDLLSDDWDIRNLENTSKSSRSSIPVTNGTGILYQAAAITFTRSVNY